MWIKRFNPWLLDLLRESGHPDIASVEMWKSKEGHENIVVTCKDGQKIYLWTVQSAPAGGEDRTKPEVIVTKANLTETQLAARREGR